MTSSTATGVSSLRAGRRRTSAADYGRRNRPRPTAPVAVAFSDSQPWVWEEPVSAQRMLPLSAMRPSRLLLPQSAQKRTSSR